MCVLPIVRFFARFMAAYVCVEIFLLDLPQLYLRGGSSVWVRRSFRKCICSVSMRGEEEDRSEL